MNVTKTANSITLEFANSEMTVLADSLIDPLSWIETAATEKLANCQSRMAGEWLNKFKQDKRIEAIPTDDKALLELIVSQPDYLTRADRVGLETVGAIKQ